MYVFESDVSYKLCTVHTYTYVATYLVATCVAANHWLIIYTIK